MKNVNLECSQEDSLNPFAERIEMNFEFGFKEKSKIKKIKGTRKPKASDCLPIITPDKEKFT